MSVRLTVIRNRIPHGTVVSYSAETREYRINLRGNPEDTAYYTDDAEDAVATAYQMYFDYSEARMNEGEITMKYRIARTTASGSILYAELGDYPVVKSWHSNPNDADVFFVRETAEWVSKVQTSGFATYVTEFKCEEE